MEYNSIRLTPELIPESTWNINFRNEIGENKWRKISNKLKEENNYQCSICKAKPEKIKIHAHETWRFDDENHTQVLEDIIIVCKKCHDVIHFARSSKEYESGYIEELIGHFYKVNNKEYTDGRLLGAFLGKEQLSFIYRSSFKYKVETRKGHQILQDKLD